MGEGGGLKSDKISVSYYLNDHQFLSHNTGSYFLNREEEALIVIIDVDIFVAVVVVVIFKRSRLWIEKRTIATLSR